MSMRKLGGTLSREAVRTGFAVMAVAAVILVYQGCSQPVEPVAEDPATPGTVNAQEETAQIESVDMVEEPVADSALEESPEVAEPAAEQMAQAQEADPHAGHDMTQLEMPTKAVALITPTVDNAVRGTVTFTKQDDGVLVEAELTGLEPGNHGFHIHEFGDITAPDGTSAGGHFAPGGTPHGAPNADQRHMGDLGNIEAGEDGNATYSRVDSHVQIHYIVGRAVVIHAGEDDLTSQPTGDAGGRVGIGVIGIAKGE